MIRLNLGSGSNRMQDGYVNVDLHTDADLQHDLTTALPYQDNSVDHIYSSHVIEHFSRRQWDFVRKDWARVLKPGASMDLRCPDLFKLCQNFADAPDQFVRLEQIYGQQAHPGEFHKNGFTVQSLTDSFPGFTPTLLQPSSDYELHMRFTKQ